VKQLAIKCKVYVQKRTRAVSYRTCLTIVARFDLVSIRDDLSEIEGVAEIDVERYEAIIQIGELFDTETVIAEIENRIKAYVPLGDPELERIYVDY